MIIAVDRPRDLLNEVVELHVIANRNQVEDVEKIPECIALESLRKNPEPRRQVRKRRAQRSRSGWIVGRKIDGSEDMSSSRAAHDPSACLLIRMQHSLNQHC